MSMYLVGELGSTRDWWKGCGMVKVKPKITREDLGKAKANSDFHVIDLERLSFFDPEKNDWVEFDTEFP